MIIPRFYLYCMASMPYAKKSEIPGEDPIYGTDITRVVIDVHRNNVEDFQPGVEPNTTVVGLRNGRYFTLHISFDEFYNIMNSQCNIDNRYEEDINMYKKDMFNEINRFRNSDRETD